MPQVSDLKALLLRQWVTPLDAWKILGIYNFSARLTELKRTDLGKYALRSEWREVNGKRFRAYQLRRVK
jgi:hypothetical protein